MDFKQSVSILKERLMAELPGEQAQYKMAPIKRKSSVEKYSQGKSVKNSAVLLLIYPKNNLTYLVLIRRAIDTSHHSGQIALPGGAYETHDADYKQTALREAHEEIGISPSSIEILGNLSKLFIPVSNYWVHPYIGLINHEPDFIPDAREVDEILSYKMQYFLNPAIIKQHEFDTMSGHKIAAPYYELEKDKLWGATAMILSEFIDLINIKK